jgi:predicted transcriptional regulator
MISLASIVGVVPLTLSVPDELAGRLLAAAEARRVSVERVAVEAIEAGLGVTGRRLSFSGVGRSADGRGGAQADELVAEHFAGKTAADV